MSVPRTVLSLGNAAVDRFVRHLEIGEGRYVDVFGFQRLEKLRVLDFQKSAGEWPFIFRNGQPTKRWAIDYLFVFLLTL